MISAKITAPMLATAVLGVGSPLAVMAQLPEEDEVDTSVREVIAGIRADIQDILDEEIVAALGPDVDRCLTAISQDPRIGVGIPPECLQI